MNKFYYILGCITAIVASLAIALYIIQLSVDFISWWFRTTYLIFDYLRNKEEFKKWMEEKEKKNNPQ